MICPRCSVAEISPVTNQCELCGYTTTGGVAVSAPDLDALEEAAKTELAHRFSLSALLRRGPTSIVYLTHEPDIDLQLALKVVPRPQDGGAEARFQRVLAAAGALNHPHIVPVHGFGTTTSTFWYTMEFVRGRSLREVLHDDGPMEVDACLRTVEQIASALDHAHRRGIVHGDLKPENVIIDTQRWAQVCDFAARGALQGGMPAHPAGATPRRTAYRAPEVRDNGPRDPYSDQYALAVLAYECLTGTVPAEGATVQASLPGQPAAALPSTGEQPPEIPPHFLQAIRRAMSPKPTDRFAGVLEFVAALEARGAPLALAAPTGSTSGRLLLNSEWKPPSGTRRRWVVPALVTAVVAVIFWLIRFGVDRTPVVTRPEEEPPNAAEFATPPPTNIASPPAPAVAPPPAPPSPRRAIGDPTGATPRPPRRAAPDVASPTPPAPTRDRGAEPRAEPAGAATGRLFVNANPWGQLYLDGQLVGNTPKANLEIAAGTHRIRVVRDGFEPFERTIEVAAGQTIRLTDIVLVARQP